MARLKNRPSRAFLIALCRVRHLPVLENDRLVGIVSLGDVIKHQLEETELEASVLRDLAIAVH